MNAPAPVFIASWRQARDISEIKSTWTVGDLIARLQCFDEDAPVYIEGYDGNLFNAVDDGIISGGE